VRIDFSSCIFSVSVAENITRFLIDGFNFHFLFVPLYIHFNYFFFGGNQYDLTTYFRCIITLLMDYTFISKYWYRNEALKTLNIWWSTISTNLIDVRKNICCIWIICVISTVIWNEMKWTNKATETIHMPLLQTLWKLLDMYIWNKDSKFEIVLRSRFYRL